MGGVGDTRCLTGPTTSHTCFVCLAPAIRDSPAKRSCKAVDYTTQIACRRLRYTSLVLAARSLSVAPVALRSQLGDCCDLVWWPGRSSHLPSDLWKVVPVRLCFKEYSWNVVPASWVPPVRTYIEGNNRDKRGSRVLANKILEIRGTSSIYGEGVRVTCSLDLRLPITAL